MTTDQHAAAMVLADQIAERWELPRWLVRQKVDRVPTERLKAAAACARPDGATVREYPGGGWMLEHPAVGVPIHMSSLHALPQHTYMLPSHPDYVAWHHPTGRE